MALIQWLQELGRNANPSDPHFHPQFLYLVVCVAMPVLIGLCVGFGLRLLERISGIEIGKGGH